jgi:hypothetical protein
LFAKAIGNHLTMAAAFAPVSAKVAAKRDTWLDDQSVNVGGFFGRMATGLKSAWGGRDGDDVWTTREKQREAAIAEAAPVTTTEAFWLAERLNRDGGLSPAEEALARFLTADGAEIPAPLKSLFARVA